jgi:UDP-N-acetylmuramyl tripeptide synthase
MFGIWLGKLAMWLLRLMHRRATSLPGKIALRLSPRLLWRLGRQLDRCVIVTGTNGKTTTASLLAAMLNADDTWIHNTEGANMQQGLATALIAHTSWFGRLRVRQAVLEVDEATLPQVIDAFPVRVLVITNVFRDQLDRYGELDTTLQKLLEGVRRSDAALVVNGDDPLAHYIALEGGRPVTCYGLTPDQVRPAWRDQMRDGAFCLRCGARLRYEGFFYGGLGLYECPECDFRRPHPDIQGEYEEGRLRVSYGHGPSQTYRLPVRGLYNAYNVLAAIAAARVCGLRRESVARGLERFHPPLGRMQPFATHPEATLNLVKNPTGCDSVLQALVAERGPKVVCVAINDLAADGRDVSWLWDADFEYLIEAGDVAMCVASGLRAEDMAVRLKYAGLTTDRILCIPDLEEAIRVSLASANDLGGLPVHVLTTYTALYPAAQILKRIAESSARPAAGAGKSGQKRGTA